MWKLVHQCSVYYNPDSVSEGGRSVPICQFNLILKFPYIMESVQLAAYYSPYPFLIFCIYDGHSAASVDFSPTLSYMCVCSMYILQIYTQISSSSGCFSSSLSARLATTDYIKRFDSLPLLYIYMCVCPLDLWTSVMLWLDSLIPLLAGDKHIRRARNSSTRRKWAIR